MNILLWGFAFFVAVVVLSYCALVASFMRPLENHEAGRHHEH